MHNFLRKNKKAIVWVVVIAFLVGTVVFGYVINAIRRNQSQNISVQAIATVNGELVSSYVYSQQIRQAAQFLSGLPSDQLLMYKYQILNSLIERNLLLQLAEKNKVKVKVTSKDVDDYIEEIKTNYQWTDEDLNNALANVGISMSRWKVQVKDSLEEEKLIAGLMDKVAVDVFVSDQEIVEEYEQVKVSKIYIKNTEDDAGRKKAEEALTKINTGVDFAQVVEEYSETGNKDNGGDIGFISRSSVWMLSESLIESAFAMQPGEISELLEADGGYYILQVTDKKAAEGEDFEAKKAEIEDELLNEKKAKVQNEWFKNEKEQAEIVIKDTEIAGYQALMQEDFETAIQLFGEAIENAPKNDGYYTYLAWAYQQVDQNDKAVETYLKAVEEIPSNWKLHYELGLVYKELEEKDKAVSNLRMASDFAGDDKIAHQRIQSVFTQMGITELVLAEQVLIDEIIRKEEEAKRLAEEAAAQEQAANDAAQENPEDVTTTNDAESPATDSDNN